MNIFQKTTEQLAHRNKVLAFLATLPEGLTWRERLREVEQAGIGPLRGDLFYSPGHLKATIDAFPAREEILRDLRALTQVAEQMP